MEEASARTAEASQAARARPPQCERAVENLLEALPTAAPDVTEQTLPSYEALQAYATITRRWTQVIRVTSLMLAKFPDLAGADEIIRAYGEYATGFEMAERIPRRAPKLAPDMVASGQFLPCRGPHRSPG